MKNKVKGILITGLIVCGITHIHAQGPIPIPVEVFFGHNSIYSQTVVKKPFQPGSKFSFFGLATYTADYKNQMDKNSLVMVNQVSYTFWKGFGIMSGVNMNSKVGFSPIIGPQHNYASRKFLAVTVLSYYLNEDRDLSLFGLYEYKPDLNEKLIAYNRIQFLYNHNLNQGTHNRSYLYIRTGLQKKNLIFGLAANLDQAGPMKSYEDNYGLFIRWNFL